MRGGRALPLYARVKQANAPLAIVLPAGGGSSSTSGGCNGWQRLLSSWGLADAAHTPRLPAGSAGAALREPLRGGDIQWCEFVAPPQARGLLPFQAHVADAYEISNILFSSGTTVSGLCRLFLFSLLAVPCFGLQLGEGGAGILACPHHSCV